MAIEGHPKPSEYPFLIRSHEERLDKLESYRLDVMVERLGNVRDELRAVKRAVYGLLFSIVLASVTTAFTVIALVGRG